MKTTDTSENSLPSWDLNTIYKDFSDGNYRNHKKELSASTVLLKEKIELLPDKPEDYSPWLASCIKGLNDTLDLYENLYAYVYTKFTENTRNTEAQKEMNLLDEAGLPLKSLQVNFRNKLAEIKESIPDLVSKDSFLQDYSFFLKEELFFQSRQMSPEEEDLASDLSRCGGEAWGRLQEAVSSTLSVLWEVETGERKTVTELRSLAYNKDREIRKKAFNLELSAWKSMEVPLSFSINGVKGFSTILNKRRHYGSTLEKSTYQARISDKTLSCMIGAMEKALPDFRRYLKAKAKVLGLKVCSFYDIFAPLGKDPKKWSFQEAEELILTKFYSFSKDLGDLARLAFTNRWIDAPSKNGKVGGAYCISFPLKKESRILTNFGGAFGDVITVGHELGHAFHHHVLKEESYIHRNYPMTLAETASIFNEGIILEGALSQTQGEEALTILETYLQETTQVIVDILSRFYFERELMARREKAELSPEELCSMMLEAQKATYGEALNPEELHPYMWAVKGHYYRTDLAFYNFPYAFGQLFGLGLFSLYKEKGSSFTTQYRDILCKTGKTRAEDIAREAGFDLESPGFWEKGLEAITLKIDDFVGKA